MDDIRFLRPLRATELFLWWYWWGLEKGITLTRCSWKGKFSICPVQGPKNDWPLGFQKGLGSQKKKRKTGDDVILLFFT
jgi:hypothetical protein